MQQHGCNQQRGMADNLLIRKFFMPHHDVNIKLNTSTKTFDDVNGEITAIKLLIGLIATKLTQDCRDNLLSELNSLGKPDLAKMLEQFFPK